MRMISCSALISLDKPFNFCLILILMDSLTWVRVTAVAGQLPLVSLTKLSDFPSTTAAGRSKLLQISLPTVVGHQRTSPMTTVGQELMVA